ncbi:flagellar hook-length control protein FliK [Parasphingorhabdus sp. JC815]|uniref:flagellar hook-length control protein FliK n=1 Tax=Parasphingorhabdus sp. JC815 TaxID=3232140 RepID=UPI00345781D5
MNGLVQLTPKSTASPLKSQSILSEDEQISSSFSNAFIDASINETANSATNIVTAGDGIESGIDQKLVENSEENITNDRPVIESAISEEPEPLKPDVELALLSVVESKKPEVFIKPRAGVEGESVTGAFLETAPISAPISKVASAIASPDQLTAEIVVSQGGIEEDTAAQDKLLQRSTHIPSPLVRDASIKDKPVAITEQLPSKAARSLAEVPAKASAMEQKIFTALASDDLAPDEFAPVEEASLRVVRSGPAQLVNVNVSAATINDTAMTQNAAASSAMSPAPLSPMAVSSTLLPPSNMSAPVSAPVPTFAPTLNMDTGNEWVSRLSQDIGQLSAEKPELNFQLKPEHLGKLSIKITAGAAGDIVRMEAENGNVKALIISSQTRLEQDIRLSGLKLSRVDVVVQDDAQFDQGSGPRDDGSGNRATGENLLQDAQRQDQSPKSRSQGFSAEADMLAQNDRSATAATSQHYGARYA